MDSLGILLIATVSVQVVWGSHNYNGPIAIHHVLHNGYLADTHEVAAAKSAHLAALATQSHGHGYEGSYGYGHREGYSGSYGEYDSHGDFRYHGPTAIPHVLHDGHIADTHEVAAAKAEHFAAVAKAKAHTGYGQDYSGRYAGGYGEHSGSYNGYSKHVAPYHGPLAKPVVLKSGYLADTHTHEVATAKHHHLEALATQAHDYGYGRDYGYGENYGYNHGEGNTGPIEKYEGHGDLRYHGPTAIPHVLHDGHIADTHEVAAAKAEHFATVAKTKARAGYGHDYSERYTGESGGHPGAHHEYSNYAAPYH